MRRLTRITIDEREKFRLSGSSCENRDVGPLMCSKGVDRERRGV